MNMHSMPVLAALLALATAPAMAGVHRCIDADGKVTFSDTVCNGVRAEKSFGAVNSAKGWKEETYRPTTAGARQDVTPVSVQAPAHAAGALKTR
ncbi:MULTISPECIES: DUF4124 domain-containing protein [unclassified Variovorax]|uniref:DUF4124 domain-containing protein n=1 Tax=unclassified Variovorax TaxID=663243 RepID=UPI001BD21B17|nr:MULTISPECIES: DUF4124 domain-containing protein [unclassified Variovorax]